MSSLNRRDYFINLRKSYHVRIHSNSETHIFLDTENKFSDPVEILIQSKSAIQSDLNRIDLLLSKLEDKLEQYKFGLPTLLIATEQEHYRSNAEEINTLSLKIKGQLEIFSSKKDANNALALEQLKANIGANLANRLTDQFEQFQVFQKMFNSILYERVKAAAKVTPPTVSNTADVQNEEVNPSNSGEMCTVVMDEGQEAMLEERSQEIEQVITDTQYVNEILNQIQVMTVQQGSLLDRIDVNLDRTRVNLTKAIGRLEKTAESFSVHQKRLILFFITMAIFVVSMLILWK